MKNQKGFIIPIVIILALIILAIIAYLFSPKSISTINVKIPSPSPVTSPDPTANWNMYTNSKYKFSFKTPLSLKVMNEFEYDPQWIQNKDIVMLLDIKKGDFKAYLLAIFKSKGLNINDWVYKDNVAMPKESVNTSSFSMNGLDIMVYEGNNSKFYLFKKDDMIYFLQTDKTADSEPKQILSTFKFIQ